MNSCPPTHTQNPQSHTPTEWKLLLQSFSSILDCVSTTKQSMCTKKNKLWEENIILQIYKCIRKSVWCTEYIHVLKKWSKQLWKISINEMRYHKKPFHYVTFKTKEVKRIESDGIAWVVVVLGKHLYVFWKRTWKVMTVFDVHFL